MSNILLNDYKGGLCGLVNFGATCYLNSIIQSLINNNHLLFNIFKKKYDINCSNSELMINELDKLLNGVWKENCIVVPKSFVQTFSNIEKTNLNNQNDPDEYYEKLVNKLYDEICKIKIIDETKNIKKADSEWNNYFNNKFCFVNDVFFGQYKSEIICLNCNHNTLSYNPFITLKLELVNNNIISCLKSHLSWEHNIQYTCEKCQEKNNAKKRFTIIKIPDIFVITLKRYNNIIEKNDKIVNYPLNFEIDNNKLELYCIINHFGPNIYCGHYTSYVKYIKNNKWYHMNDNNIDEDVDINNIDKSNVYMLFYKKIKN